MDRIPRRSSLLSRSFGGVAVSIGMLAPGACAHASVPFFAPEGASRLETPPRGLPRSAVPVRLNTSALLALRPGDEARLELPEEPAYTVVFEKELSHGGGTYSWSGYLKDTATRKRILVTTGPNGSFGEIETPGRTYRIVPGSGHDWLVDMTKVGASEQKRPPPDDMRIPPGR